MICNIKCPFFLTKKVVGYIKCYCRLEQSSIFIEDWTPMIYSEDKKCHIIEKSLMKIRMFFK